MRNPLIGRVTSHYNLNRKHPITGSVQAHRGIDIGAPESIIPIDYIGADVRAAYAGTVARVENNWKSGWSAIIWRSGDAVLIRNPDGEHQWYGHLSRVDVKVGQVVAEGQVIGGMGASGNVTGPHLHFECHNWSSHDRNNWTHTRDPMLDFNAAGITPGVDNPPVMSTATSKDWFTMATKNDLRDVIRAEITNIWRHEMSHPRTGDKSTAGAYVASGYANGQDIKTQLAKLSATVDGLETVLRNFGAEYGEDVGTLIDEIHRAVATYIPDEIIIPISKDKE